MSHGSKLIDQCTRLNKSQVLTRRTEQLRRRRRVFQVEQLDARRLLVNDVTLSAELPLGFELSSGGSNEFQARGSGYNVAITASQVSMALSRPIDIYADILLPSDPNTHQPLPSVVAKELKPETTILNLALVGANTNAVGTPRDVLARKSNYLLGDDPGQWRLGVANYGQVQYADVYSCIDVRYYGTGRNLQYDFNLAAGAEASQIKLRFDGADQMQVDGNGNLAVRIGSETVFQHRPVVYQTINGQRVDVSGGYRLWDTNLVGFELGNYDARQPLVIDPILSYATLVGGSGTDQGFGMTVDDLGNAYVVGLTSSTNFLLLIIV